MEAELYSGNYAVVGPPGTGKTTFLATRTERCLARGETVMLCSLTRTAEHQIRKKRIPIKPDAIGTLHAHAYRAIDRPEVVADKHLADWNASHGRGLEWRITSLDDDFRSEVSQPGDFLLQRLDLYRHRMTNPQAWRADVTKFGAAWTAWKDANGLIDFTNMIEIALRDTRHAKGMPQVIMADEAQDMSRLEFELLTSWARWANALIITGDPWQALYTWRGASSEIFGDERIPPDHCGVLTQSYRVPGAVHAAATTWIRQLSTWKPTEYLPRPFPGRAERFNASLQNVSRVIIPATEHIAAGKSVMICATANYMLRNLAYELRRRAIPFANPWRLHRGDWNPLCRGQKIVTATDRVVAYLRPALSSLKIIQDECTACGGSRQGPDGPCWVCTEGEGGQQLWTIRDVHRWIDALASKDILQHGAKARLKELIDKSEARGGEPIDFATLRSLFAAECAEFPVRADQGLETVESMIDWYLPRMLTTRGKAMRYPFAVARKNVAAVTEPPRLFVGTIHSFKGAESDVMFVFPNLSPQAYRGMSTVEGRDSVIRMFYVAMTRARESLFLCQASDIRAVSWSKAFDRQAN